MDPEAQHIAGQALTEGGVADVLHAPRIVNPIVTERRVRFGLADRLSIDVRGTGHLFHRRIVVRMPTHRAIRFEVAFPELAHRHVVDSLALERIDPMIEERPAGFRVRAAQAARDRQLAQPAVVVGRHQIGGRAAIVLQEPAVSGRIVHGVPAAPPATRAADRSRAGA